jgi:hypothetical protein
MVGPGHEVRFGHAHGLEDIGEWVRSLGQLGRTTLHEAKANHQTQGKKRPTIDGETK